MNDKALREALEQHEYQKFYLGAGCKCGWRTQLMHEADCWPAWCGHAAALASQPEQAPAFPVFAGYGAPGAIAPAQAEEAGTPFDARVWLLAGGGGHEGGADGLRALTVTGEGLIDFLEAFKVDLLAAGQAAKGEGKHERL